MRTPKMAAKFDKFSKMETFIERRMAPGDHTIAPKLAYIMRAEEIKKMEAEKEKRGLDGELATTNPTEDKIKPLINMPVRFSQVLVRTV